MICFGSDSGSVFCGSFGSDSASDSGSGSCFGSGNAGLRARQTRSFLFVKLRRYVKFFGYIKFFREIVLEKKRFLYFYFFYCAIGWEIVNFIREVFCFKFIPGKTARILIRNDLIRIRLRSRQKVRIHNTAQKDTKRYCILAFTSICKIHSFCWNFAVELIEIPTYFFKPVIKWTFSLQWMRSNGKYNCFLRWQVWLQFFVAGAAFNNTDFGAHLWFWLGKCFRIRGY